MSKELSNSTELSFFKIGLQLLNCSKEFTTFMASKNFNTAFTKSCERKNVWYCVQHTHVSGKRNFPFSGRLKRMQINSVSSENLFSARGARAFTKGVLSSDDPLSSENVPRGLWLVSTDTERLRVRNLRAVPARICII